MYLALGMYASYFVLFANFFVKAYFGRRSRALVNNNNINSNGVKKVD
jgi:hypothetical protein